MARETAEFLIQTFREAYPDVDIRIGTVPRDWLITPSSLLLEPYEEQRAAIEARQSISNYEALTPEEMADLAANLFVYPNLGVRARANIILGFPDPTAVTLDAGTLVENADGTKQYATLSAFVASRPTIEGNQREDGLFYTAPILVEATEAGDSQVAEADELIYMPFPPVGLQRVTNPEPSQWGAAAETNEQIFARVLTAISTRQVMNEPGTRGVLLAQFRHIREMLLIGTGHELMERDETYSYTDLGGRLLPVASMYGKVRGDGSNGNRALRLATTVAVPESPTSFLVEVSQAEYQGLGVVDDAEVATLDTGLIFTDDFSRSSSFVETEMPLTDDADVATSSIMVESTAFFGVGDLVELEDDDTSPERRTVLSIGVNTIELSEDVMGLTMAANALVRRVPRASDVGNGWIESSHGEVLGTELAGIQALVEGGKLVFRPVDGIAAADAENDIRDILKAALADGGYVQGEVAAVNTAIDAMSIDAAVTTAVTSNSVTATSPVVQRPLPQQNGLRIRGQFSTTDSSDEGKILWITTRRPRSGNASYYAGFGAAIRRSAALSDDFTSTPVPRVTTSGGGSGATISSVTVNADGDITDVVWAIGGTGYADGDDITFTQGEVSADYTLQAADVSGGVLQDLTGKTLAGERDGVTETTSDTAEDDTTISVTSTTGFKDSGPLVITVGTEHHVVTYTAKTSDSFTGCVGTPATTTGQVVAASKNTLFIVDDGDLGSSDNAYLAANDSPVEANTDYWFELLITPPSGEASDESSSTEFRLWKDDTTTNRPSVATLAYGSYIPTAALSGSADNTHFGIAAHDNDAQEWSFDSIRIDSIAPVYPHYLFRFDASDFDMDDRFRVQVKGWAEGQNEDGAEANGMDVRLWNPSTNAWEDIGSHEETGSGLVESAMSHEVNTYRDGSEHIRVMVSGEYAWGLGTASALYVDYAAIIDNGVEGVHVGGKADIYVRSESGIRVAFVDLDAVDQLVVLGAGEGFVLPIASIDAIFLRDAAGRPTGGALQEGVDYTLAINNPNLRYSAHEQVALAFAPDIQTSDVRVFYSTFQFIGDIQSFIEGSSQRLTAADVLARAFLPAFVTVTIEMSGFTIADEAMRRGLVTFVNNAGRTLEPSDIINEAYRLGATSVETDLTVAVERHATDGTKTNTTLTTQMELAENERFYARAVNVIRI